MTKKVVWQVDERIYIFKQQHLLSPGALRLRDCDGACAPKDSEMTRAFSGNLRRLLPGFSGRQLTQFSHGTTAIW